MGNVTPLPTRTPGAIPMVVRAALVLRQHVVVEARCPLPRCGRCATRADIVGEVQARGSGRGV